jgi:hypothetical protein
MTLISKIGGTAFQLFCAIAISGALYPPGDVPRQLLVCATWFATGALSVILWRS